MRKINVKDLTDRQQLAWQMRYRFGWRMKKIAIEMGLQKSSVSRLLQRAHIAAGLPPRRNLRIIRTKPRRIRLASLSDVLNY